jgi:hypothetical protein
VTVSQPPSARTGAEARPLEPLAVGSLCLALLWPGLIALRLFSGFVLVGWSAVLTAPLAWVLAIGFGWAALARMRRTGDATRGRWMAVSGIVVSAVQLVAAAVLAIALAVVCSRPNATCFQLVF